MWEKETNFFSWSCHAYHTTHIKWLGIFLYKMAKCSPSTCWSEYRSWEVLFCMSRAQQQVFLKDKAWVQIQWVLTWELTPGNLSLCKFGKSSCWLFEKQLLIIQILKCQYIYTTNSMLGKKSNIILSRQSPSNFLFVALQGWSLRGSEPVLSRKQLKPG